MTDHVGPNFYSDSESFIRKVKVLNSYCVIFICYFYISIYAYVYENFLVPSKTIIIFQKSPILLFGIIALLIVPIIVLLVKGEEYLISIAEITLYIIGAISLAIITWLVIQTGGLFGSYISWVYEYIFVLSLQLRVFSITKFSWRASLTTLALIIFLCLFMEIQLNYSLDPEILESKTNSDKSSYFLLWTEFIATIVGVIINQLAIDIFIKFDYVGRLLAKRTSTQAP